MQCQCSITLCSFSTQQTLVISFLFCRAEGRKDLVTAVHRCGGFQAVASYLGAAFQETRGRPLGARGAQAAKRRSPGRENLQEPFWHS